MDWDWTRGEWEGEGENACVGEWDVGECTALLKGNVVLTCGTGKEGANEAAVRPREEERGSGRLLVRLRLGEPVVRGLCLMFLNTFL